MSKRILQINVTANWGSTGKIAEQIGILVMKEGWESYIAYGRMMNPSKSKLIKIGTQWDVYLHYALSRFFDWEGLASKIATRKLIKKIDRINPDVIHLHNIHDHYLNYPILFEYMASHDIPIVWTQHDQWATTGHCAYNMVGCEKWKKRCYDCPNKKRWAWDRSERNYFLKKKWFTSIKRATIVTVSDWLKTQEEQSFLSKFPIKVIKNGVDINVFKPQKVYNNNIRSYGELLGGGKSILLGVAHPWSERKGLNDYVRLSGILPDSCVIVLVGLSDEQRQSLPYNIIGLGATQDVNELVMLYNIADIVLNLSYAETFGLTTVEGLACGTPGIVYNTTASPELITPETGIVVEAGDVDGVAKAVSTIISHGKAHYSVACRKRAEVHYDINSRYDDYIQLYKMI